MTHEQFEKAFTEYDVYRPDLAKILSKKVSHEITDKGKTIKKENKDIGKKKYDSARESNENPELEIKIPKRNPNGLHEANTSKQSIEKVKRSSDVVAIGDLHGEMIALEGNLKSAKLIDENGNWIGGNKKVVFQ
ncbi:MAG: hypothetical protein LBD11_00200 [Candidatus Peribacteria bacterium]|jgi:hypothetical protein|nr:hypothetical protein [Candidatus Peribacteria bacterium]